MLEGSYKGFLVDRDANSSIYDVEGDFSKGAYFDGPASFCGTLFGLTTISSVHGATVRGIVDWSSTTTAGGGIVVAGLASAGTSLNMVRNIATFANRIDGYYAGCIAGHVTHSTLTNSLNTMKGDLVSTACCGGTTGRCFGIYEIHSVVDSMTGNVVDDITGGLIGMVQATVDYGGLTASKLLKLHARRCSRRRKAEQWYCGQLLQ